MRRYLYLTKREWAHAWVDGGVVPILPASTYRSPDRQGTHTPDENLIHDSPVDIKSLSQHGYHFENVRGLTFVGNSSNGRVLPSFVNADFYEDDGLILSFSNRKSREICQRLGKTACVAIDNIDSLEVQLNNQLGTRCVAGNCMYTFDHQRSHFLKSVQDEWQHEFRMFWPIREPRQVAIPARTGRRIKIGQL